MWWDTFSGEGEQKIRKQNRVVVSVPGSVLWGGSFGGSSRRNKNAWSFLDERLCYGAVPGGLAEKRERRVISA